MIDNVIVGNQKYALAKEDVIGEGGESIIFRLNKAALKVYRNPTKQREQKLLDFFSNDFQLPLNVLFPLEPAYSQKGRLIGFTMHRLKDGCDPIGVLKNKKYCAQNRINTKTIIDIFSNVHPSLVEIHKVGIMAGDLNDRNEVLNSSHNEVAWIDVDSWQWRNHPCMVATEDYLSPDLYGIDLSKKPYFKEEHDWFSFVVLLFRSLLGIHPFKTGIHPEYKSLMVRAQKGITVLDADVRYPSIGLSPDILSDDLISLLLDYLKREKKDSFPFEALQEYKNILVECPSCQLWYDGTRSHCPGCQVKNVFDMRLRQILAGCECESLITTSGRIIFFKVVKDDIYCLADEKGVTFLYQKSKGQNVSRKELFKTRAGAHFGLFEENLVVCLDPIGEQPELLVLDISGSKPKALLKTMTKSITGGKAVFSCSNKYLYRIVGSLIMRGQVFEGTNQLLEREVMQSLQGQTWFTVSPNPSGLELLMGFYRLFGELKWFLVRSDSDTSFQRFEVDLSKLTDKESLIDLSIKFSDTSVLVLRKTRKQGIDYIRMDVVNGKNGKVSNSYFEKIEGEFAHYENIHGRAFRMGTIMHPTDQGVIREKVIDQTINILADSDQFVTNSDALHAYDDSVLAVTNDRVLLLKPNKRR